MAVGFTSTLTGTACCSDGGSDARVIIYNILLSRKGQILHRGTELTRHQRSMCWCKAERALGAKGRGSGAPSLNPEAWELGFPTRQQGWTSSRAGSRRHTGTFAAASFHNSKCFLLIEL